jgi:hypothetical protein
MRETWLPVKGYEGIYLVSNLGRVKSLTRVVRNARWGVDTPKVLHPVMLKEAKYGNGYCFVMLSKLGRVNHAMIHRLVAQAFLPNPHKKRTVNHINGIKADNRVENLEWATHSENMKHASDTGLTKMKGGENPYARKVTIEKNGVKTSFDTQREAAKFIGVKDVNVSSAKIKNGTCRGYKIYNS